MNNIQPLIIVCIVSTVVGISGGVYAACEDNWKDCAGQPWVDGDVMETPLGSKWWPHPIWGEGDEAGSTNWYKKPEVVMRALAQIKQGKTVRLGHDYQFEMPLFPGRGFAHRTGVPTGGIFGYQMMMYNDEYYAADVDQNGTGLEGPGRVAIAIGDVDDRDNVRHYNGWTAAEMESPYGLKRLGAEKMHPGFCPWRDAGYSQGPRRRIDGGR